MDLQIQLLLKNLILTYMETLKVFYLLILVFVILDSCKLGLEPKINIESQKVISQFNNSRIKINCEVDQIVFYSDTNTTVSLNKDQYKINYLKLNSESLISSAFCIVILENKEKILLLKQSHISICYNGHLYHGVGLPDNDSEVPIVGDFLFKWEFPSNKIKFFDSIKIICYDTKKYLSH